MSLKLSFTKSQSMISAHHRNHTRLGIKSGLYASLAIAVSSYGGEKKPCSKLFSGLLIHKYSQPYAKSTMRSDLASGDTFCHLHDVYPALVRILGFCDRMYLTREIVCYSLIRFENLNLYEILFQCNTSRL